jgi:hypothetical protein
MSNTLWSAPVQSVLGCKIPHELDALKWKAIGRRRREEEEEEDCLTDFNKTSFFVVFRLFRVCIFNSSEKAHISYHPNHL